MGFGRHRPMRLGAAAASASDSLGRLRLTLCSAGVDKFEHLRAFEQSLFCFEHIGDAIGRGPKAANYSLGDGAFGRLPSVRPRKPRRPRPSTPAASSSLKFQSVSASHARVGFADDLAQAVAIGQRKIEKLDEAGQLGRHFDGGCG